MQSLREEPTFLRENDARVFQALKTLVCADRAALTLFTDLARSTVYDACQRLKRQGILQIFKQKITPGNGIPNTIYVLNPQYAPLTTEEWRRLTTTIIEVYHFFARLHPDQWLSCAIQEGNVRYGEQELFCKTRCGVRIQCVQTNKDVIAHAND